MPRRVSKRFVVITGTSTGIGRACVVRLAAEGFCVIATVRSPGDAQSIEQSGAGTACGIRAIQLDVTREASIDDAASQIRAHVGNEGLYGLVNNAGICVVGPIECIGLDQWRQQFEVNLFGVIGVVQRLLPLLRLHNLAYGRWAARIINVNSVTGQIATPVFGAYSASKFALEALSDVLRHELKPDGIHVCSVVPGTVQSEIWRKEKEGIDAIRRSAPLARGVYRPLIQNVAGYVFACAANALPADRVALVVQRCLTRRYPPHRIGVGWEAVVGTLARRLMPQRLLHYLMARTLNVPSSLPRDERLAAGGDASRRCSRTS